MDDKMLSERVSIITQLANQIGILQYAGKVPQHGPVNSVNSAITKFAENEDLDLNNPDVRNEITAQFRFMMGEIIRELGD